MQAPQAAQRIWSNPILKLKFLPRSLWTATALDSNKLIFNAVYDKWDSPDQLASWAASSGKTACEMTGVACSITGEVTSLSLQGTYTGMFEPLLFNLTALSRLVLVGMGLIDCILPQISQLVNLRLLKLSNNHLTGTLPPSMSRLVALTALVMNSNQLTGFIPQQLSTLKHLCQLQLGNNRLSGPLPASLSCLTARVVLYAPFNTFSGSISAQYSVLQQLTRISLSSNSITNSIPPQLANNTQLSMSLNDNPAICGKALPMFESHRGTHIGQDCPPVSKGKFYLQSCSMK